MGWYEGFHLLLSVNPQGVITGFSFAPAGAKDQTLAEDFFAFQHTPNPRLPTLGAPPELVEGPRNLAGKWLCPGRRYTEANQGSEG